MTDPRKISIDDFTYELPSDRIASLPLQERDASKLLIYKNGEITEDRYKNIADHLPASSLLIFNNSKVINARIRFQRPNGGTIEIFLLEPSEDFPDYSMELARTSPVIWKCLVGGAAKWKEKKLQKQALLNGVSYTLEAEIIERIHEGFIIQFSWPAGCSFAEIIESAGDVPLPPYIKRPAEIADTERYQTIYAAQEGSVAAPTAGLHFTRAVFGELETKNISTDFVALHVGAGTFKPVKTAYMHDHEMHAEWIDVNIETIDKLLSAEHIIAVGTTSLRTIETLYWLGVKVLLNPTLAIPELKQWEVYELPLMNTRISRPDALLALKQWMIIRKRNRLFMQTQLLISPGYTFRVGTALVTNFHQPGSTLLLLVAAAAGPDWKKIYRYALEKDFRFLSYGDGNLLFFEP